MEVIPENPILEFLPDTLVAIRKIYNLENGRMDQSVDILEQWIKNQKHFMNQNFSRVYLEKTIIASKGSVEKAKTQIDKLCTLRTLMPKFFISSNVRSVFEGVNHVACVVPLPKMTKEYQRIYVVKFNSKEFTAAHYLDYYRLNLVVAQYLQANDYVNGFVIIMDFREIDLMEIVKKINLVELQQYTTILQKGFGAKMKSLYFISQSNMIDFFIKTVKAVLSDKLARRIHVHPDLESLHQVVDKEILPVDLGGNERSMKKLQDEWMDVLATEENEKYLAEMNASGTDESLRQTDKFNEQHMGLPGSFRTLTVD